jgi:hypothetical protein
MSLLGSLLCSRLTAAISGALCPGVVRAAWNQSLGLKERKRMMLCFTAMMLSILYRGK